MGTSWVLDQNIFISDRSWSPVDRLTPTGQESSKNPAAYSYKCSTALKRHCMPSRPAHGCRDRSSLDMASEHGVHHRIDKTCSASNPLQKLTVSLLPAGIVCFTTSRLIKISTCLGGGQGGTTSIGDPAWCLLPTFHLAETASFLAGRTADYIGIEADDKRPAPRRLSRT